MYRNRTLYLAKVAGSALGLDHTLERLSSIVWQLRKNLLRRGKGWSRGFEWRQSKSLAHFGLDKGGCTLVSAIGVLLINRAMVLLRTLATFEEHGHQWSKLAPGISGVMNMRRSLS
jgi:hypothetical protein